MDGSLLSTSIAFVQGLLAERSVLGIERQQQGNTSFYAAPSDAYKTNDGWIVVSVVGNDMFARWARLVGREDFIADPRFCHRPASRRQSWRDHRSDEPMAYQAHGTQEAISELEKARIPAGPVLELDQVLEDPQVKARELLRYVDHPGAAKPVPLADTAVRCRDTWRHSRTGSSAGRAH